MRRVAPLVLLASCVEYDFAGDPDPVIPEDGTCDLVGAEPGEVEIDETCLGEGVIEVEDPWNLEIEWQWIVSNGDSGVIVMPAVGNLTDDDGDGDVTDRDDPDVVFVTWNAWAVGSGTLVALNGTDGSTIFQRPNYNGQAGVTIADVDVDGLPEIIALDGSGRVVAVGDDGEPLWVSSSVSFSMQMYPQPTVADLDNDGDVEVIFDTVILDGEDGAVRATMGGLANSWRTPIAADLDLDGTREIILANGVFAPNAALEWSNAGTGAGNFAAVANVDDDDDGEVVFVSNSEMFVHDADGTLITRAPISGYNPGPPSIADFDGDGAPEIAIPANYAISVHEMDGTRLWTATMQDGSGLAGCSGYDVDGDGIYEVLFADETNLRIYDGRTGTVLFDDPTHDSATVWEYPVIADADNDGSAEILVASNSYGSSWYYDTTTGQKGVTMFGHAGSGWPKSGPTWGTHDFAVTNLEADGTVPHDETPSWLAHNVFRARPAVDVPGIPDLFVEIGEPCLSDCGPGGVVEIPFQVGNRGGGRSPNGLQVWLYAETADGLVPVTNAVVDAIDGGEIGRGGVFEVAVDDLRQASAIVVKVGPDDERIDCDASDDEARMALSICD